MPPLAKHTSQPVAAEISALGGNPDPPNAQDPGPQGLTPTDDSAAACAAALDQARLLAHLEHLRPAMIKPANEFIKPGRWRRVT